MRSIPEDKPHAILFFFGFSAEASDGFSAEATAVRDAFKSRMRVRSCIFDLRCRSCLERSPFFPDIFDSSKVKTEKQSCWKAASCFEANGSDAGITQIAASGEEASPGEIGGKETPLY